MAITNIIHFMEALLFSFERRNAGLGSRPEVWRLINTCASGLTRSRCRGEDFAQQVKQVRARALRVAAVVGEHEADDEAFIVITRLVAFTVRRLGASQRSSGMRHIHPAAWFVAKLLKLPRQAFADLARARFDLAPVAGLNLQPLGEAPLQATQRGRVGMFGRLAHKFFKQRQCIVQAHVGEIVRASLHQD